MLPTSGLRPCPLARSAKAGSPPPLAADAWPPRPGLPQQQRSRGARPFRPVSASPASSASSASSAFSASSLFSLHLLAHLILLLLLLLLFGPVSDQCPPLSRCPAWRPVPPQL